MKTFTNMPTANRIHFIFCSLLLLIAIDANAQKSPSNYLKNFGIGVTSTVTGSGHGTQYSPRFVFKTNRNLFSVGPVIQKRNLHLSGIQLGYEYTVLGDKSSGNYYKDEHAYMDGKVETFLFVKSIYNYSAYLSKAEMRLEQMSSRDNNIDFENLKFKTLENYVGFGLRVYLGNHFIWSNAIGVGGYVTLEGNDRYRDKQALGLMLRTGLLYSFKNNNN